jgi:hypothetical protein
MSPYDFWLQSGAGGPEDDDDDPDDFDTPLVDVPLVDPPGTVDTLAPRWEPAPEDDPRST